MTPKIHAVHFHADSKLIEYINERLQQAEHFYDHIINTEIFLKLDSHHTVKDKIVEIKLSIPGKTLFCESGGKSFEQVFDEALDGILKQLKKHKEKQQS